MQRNLKVVLQPKVALVHDYLREYGGAERVLEALHDIFPEAPIYTAYYNPDGLGVHKERINKWDIRTSFIQKIPLADKLISLLRVIAPMAFEGFNLKEYDVVISSCNIYFSKAVITAPETLHISYIHTPPRYLYGYTTSFNYKKNPITRFFAEIANHFLRIYDYETSQRPDILVANSKIVRERIKKFYRRDAEVIYPPVDISEFKGIKKEVGDYYLSLARLWKSKGVEIIVEACAKLNLKLRVAGTGPELENLKKIAGKNVEFLGEVTDEQRVKLLAGCKALIVAPEEEDFGINAIEAMAAGSPVIAIREGGYTESVVEGKTGEFFNPKDPVNNLIKVLEKFNPEKYKQEDCKKQAEKFSQERFKQEILGLLESHVKS